jgi:hypothetical protein
MIKGAKGEIRAANFQPFLTQHRERLGCRNLMNEMQVDIQDCWRIGGFRRDQMRRPDLVD